MKRLLLPLLAALALPTAVNAESYWLIMMKGINGIEKIEMKDIEKRQQSKRFNERQTDPLKLWKLSPNDLRMADKWEIFSFFKEQMFSSTSYEESPWIVINANNKMVARLTALRYLLNEIDYEGKKLSKPKTWDAEISNHKIEYKGVEFSGLTYQQFKMLQKLIQNQSS